LDKTNGSSTPTLKRYKALLIEDDNIIQIVHSSYLQKLGCEVDIARHGKEALDLIHNPYDIIFVDMGLPDIDGTILVKEFRKRAFNQHIPIIAITGYKSESSRQDFLAAGTDDIAIKPVFLEQLEVLLEKYCSG
jgi:hypothetical protein